MPELPEVHRYSRRINEFAASRTFTGVIFKPGMNVRTYPTFTIPGQFRVVSKVRGKELLLECGKLLIRFNLGLEGKWSFSTEGPAQKQLFVSFVTESGDWFGFSDTAPFSSWKPNCDFDLTRGPDPLLEPDAFLLNLKKPLYRTKNKAKQICDVLLDQQWFNGIGNYLRSEILHRAQIDPTTPATAVDLNLLARLCAEVPAEVLANDRLNKYGTAEEQAAFEEWLQCYQKAPFRLDKNKRKVFSFVGTGVTPPKPVSRTPLTTLPPLEAASSSSRQQQAAYSWSQTPDSTPGSTFRFDHISAMPAHALISAEENRFYPDLQTATTGLSGAQSSQTNFSPSLAGVSIPPDVFWKQTMHPSLSGIKLDSISALPEHSNFSPEENRFFYGNLPSAPVPAPVAKSAFTFNQARFKTAALQKQSQPAPSIHSSSGTHTPTPDPNLKGWFIDHIAAAPHHVLISAEEDRFAAQPCIPPETGGHAFFPSAHANKRSEMPTGRESIKAILLFLLSGAFRRNLVQHADRAVLKNRILTETISQSSLFWGLAESYLAEPDYCDWRDIAETFNILLTL